MWVAKAALASGAPDPRGTNRMDRAISWRAMVARNVKLCPKRARRNPALFQTGTGATIGGTRIGRVSMSIPIWQMTDAAPRAEFRTRLPGRTARRSQAASPMQASTCAGVIVDFVGPEAADALRPAWRDLAERALEPNVFFEPAFALAAARHLTKRRPLFAVAWEGREPGSQGRLIGVWPVQSHSSPLAPAFVQGWRHAHTALGLPILDRLRAEAAADALLGAIAQRFRNRHVVLIPQTPHGGPTYRLLVAHALATGRVWDEMSAHSRAALLSPGEAAPARDTLPPRRRKELARLRRRLADEGAVAFGSARTPDEVRNATEQFLVLEQGGWKGARRTSFLSDPANAAFLRSALRLMAREGKCRIDALTVDGRPVAMGIVLNSRDRAYFWKTSFDERFARFSPGVQLAQELTRRQGDEGVTHTDSCAIADHPMIDRLWPGRLDIVDFALAATPGSNRAARRAIGMERLRRAVRAWAKRAALAARDGLAQLRTAKRPLRDADASP